MIISWIVKVAELFRIAENDDILPKFQTHSNIKAFALYFGIIIVGYSPTVWECTSITMKDNVSLNLTVFDVKNF